MLGGVEVVVKPLGAYSGLTFGFTGRSAVGLKVWDLIPEMGVLKVPIFSSWVF